MPYFWYKRGGWEICVDAVNQRDAAHHIKIHAPGALFQGEYNPPPMGTPSTATGMTTARRQEQIHAALEKERQDWIAAGRPGAWWDDPSRETRNA